MPRGAPIRSDPVRGGDDAETTAGSRLPAGRFAVAGRPAACGGTPAFGILRTPVDPSGLVLHPVDDEPLGVVLHRRHPLAECPEPTWSDLSGRRLLWFPTERAAHIAAAVLAHLRVAMFAWSAFARQW
ncbi:LysR substrate-binding domain-containing protein [Embleya sp. MST-111070]|uniref:LysR substrate-binding domain-containing protein n=1 Tax=Embleya sp. MST-111070 TaxID=3398231 RepID=UPI003F73A99D